MKDNPQRYEEDFRAIPTAESRRDPRNQGPVYDEREFHQGRFHGEGGLSSGTSTNTSGKNSRSGSGQDNGLALDQGRMATRGSTRQGQ